MTQAASMDAAGSGLLTDPQSRPDRRPDSPPASRYIDRVRRGVFAWAPPLLAVFALGWAMAALWPRGDLAAWPAVSLGLLAVAGSWGRGPALRRALTAIAGTLAAMAGLTQIAVLWAAAAVLTKSYM